MIDRFLIGWLELAKQPSYLQGFVQEKHRHTWFKKDLNHKYDFKRQGYLTSSGKAKLNFAGL